MVPAQRRVTTRLAGTLVAVGLLGLAAATGAKARLREEVTAKGMTTWQRELGRDQHPVANGQSKAG